jgi:hypothetical protein
MYQITFLLLLGPFFYWSSGIIDICISRAHVGHEVCQLATLHCTFSASGNSLSSSIVEVSDAAMEVTSEARLLMKVAAIWPTRKVG